MVLASCGTASPPDASRGAQPATSIRAISGGTATPVPTATIATAATPVPTATALAVITSSVPTPQPQPIKIGLAGSFTGAGTLFGREMLKGAETAIDEANARGGVLGRKLVLDQGDDKTDPEGAAAAARKLLADGVAAVVGPALSAEALSAAPILDAGRIPMITPNANDPRLTDRGLRFVFRASGRWDQQGPLLLDHIVKDRGKTKVAVIADKSAYGQVLAGAYRQALSKAGLTAVLDDSIDAGAKDYAAETAKVKAQQAEAVLYGGYAAEAAVLARELGAAIPGIVFGLGDAGQDQAFIEGAGAAAAGTVLAFPPNARQVDGTTQFLDAFKRKYGTEASLFAISTYDSVNLLVDALKRAGSTDGEALRAALASTVDFGGLYWKRMSFDLKGDLQAPGYVLWTVRAGRFEQLAGVTPSTPAR